MEVLRGNIIVELFKVTQKEQRKKSLVTELSHPYIKELFDELKTLRTEFARNEGVPPYVVFSDATLIEMATYLPNNSAEMLKISGVGDVKMDKYGLDFLRTVKDYCLENNEKSRINLKTPKREPKKRTKRNADGDDTYTITLKMFRRGATIEEIAEERNLSPNTIETHLVRFIPTGEVKLTEIVAEEKIETVRKAILELNAENGIGPIKEYLGEDFSYGEIRAVVADFMRIGQAAGR